MPPCRRRRADSRAASRCLSGSLYGMSGSTKSHLARARSHLGGPLRGLRGLAPTHWEGRSSGLSLPGGPAGGRHGYTPRSRGANRFLTSSSWSFSGLGGRGLCFADAAVEVGCLIFGRGRCVGGGEGDAAFPFEPVEAGSAGGAAVEHMRGTETARTTHRRTLYRSCPTDRASDVGDHRRHSRRRTDHGGAHRNPSPTLRARQPLAIIRIFHRVPFGRLRTVERWFRA